jgi:carboxyl-terminal processing protease
MPSKYARLIGPLLVLVAVALAAYMTFFSPGRGGLELDAEREATTSTKGEGAVPPEMRSLRTLYRTINLVQKRYIDASRIDARAMLVEAMRAVQGRVAKVIVRVRGEELVVGLGAEERTFGLSDVTTPWILLQRFKEIFAFLEPDLEADGVEFEEVQYAAINGMLKRLDPHSVFLDPDQYRDMKDKTQGKFGGLGIVISIRDGVLTIISPIKGTPAYLAGLEAGDQILKIGEASTVNMPLNDAVSLLRGEPGTKVTVHILRKGWEEPRPFVITRAIVKVESLETHLLDGRVGYVLVKDFQSNTAVDLGDQLKAWGARGIRGLVIDLRGCPGGLLEAAIDVADFFLERGVIVTTAGQGPTDRDVRRAARSGAEPDYPVVVLVDRGSASASEIVAGALKNHGRGLLVGERTFGKGSVQVLYDFHDGSALKLTTSQYLTPGDVSIQSVGVVPHVELLPMRADEKMLDLIVEGGFRESDLDRHFEEVGTGAEGDQPDEQLRYLRVPLQEDLRKDGEDGTDPLTPPFEPDFEVELAAKLVLEMARAPGDASGLDVVAPTLRSEAAAEERKLTAALAKLGIDWEVGESEGSSSFTVSTRFEPAGPLAAGATAKMVLEVKNEGPGAVFRLHARSESDFRPLDERELAFGRVSPGETARRELEFRVPKDALNRTDDVKWSFRAAGDSAPGALATRFEVRAASRPRFAYSYQLVDVSGGNGDSRLQRGETVQVVLDVENVGEGAALDTFVTLKGLSGKELFMTKGREALGKLEPGDRRRAVFAFELKEGFSEAAARLELALADIDLRVYSLEKIDVPVEAPLTVEEVPGKAVTTGGVEVRVRPEEAAALVGVLPAGAAVDAEARVGDWLRVGLDDDRVGWIAAARTRPGEDGIEAELNVPLGAPPHIELEPVPRVVAAETIVLKGRVTDESRVRDVYIFVGEDKVFFEQNSDPSTPGALSFEATLPLENGLNFVTVVSEETADLDSREVITVRRDRPDGMSYLMSRVIGGDPTPLGVVPTAPENP